MSGNYDFLISFDGDIVLHDELHGVDIAVVRDGALVAQDVMRAARIPKGALLWDNTAGSDIQLSINAPTDPALAEHELLRIARDDVRIDQASIVVNTTNGKTTLQFRVLGSNSVEEVHYE